MWRLTSKEMKTEQHVYTSFIIPTCYFRYAEWQFKIRISICTNDISFIVYRFTSLLHSTPNSQADILDACAFTIVKKKIIYRNVVFWHGSPNFWPQMVIANVAPYRQSFHQVGYNCDPSDVVDILSAWILRLQNHYLCASNFRGPG